MSANEFLNRELGLLQFNERVFRQAVNFRTPLLEKTNFINIYHSNMDEFFMKRLGGLQRQVEAGLQTLSLDGSTPKEQIAQIHKKCLELNKEVNSFVERTLKSELEKNKIRLLKWRLLNAAEKLWVKNFFQEKIFPILTPVAVNQGNPFPHISTLSTSIAVSLKNPQQEELLFARIKVPPVFPMWILVEVENENKEYRFISMIDIIIQHLSLLFPKMEIKNMMTFRVTRSIDMQDSKDDDVEDLLDLISEEVQQRKYNEVVRLEHGPKPDPWLLKFLLEELEIQEDDIFPYPGRLEYKDLKSIYELNIPELKYPLWAPVAPVQLANTSVDIFTAIRNSDILVHHPFESFHFSTEKFIVCAAEDADVVSIKMTLYRTQEDGAVVRALISAAEKGKQVMCMIELKARLDEERNIHLAQKLEAAGVNVIYGIRGLKTHAKVILVVRREQGEFRSYAHIGTGNYNPVTARQYTDIGMLTSDPIITRDLTDLFHYLTGRSLKSHYTKILVAPITLKENFLKLIQQEIENKQAGLPAEIIAKMNSLEEKDVIQKLYEASRAGVKIQLMVRGFSCLRAGVMGLSENISVTSTLGRFLEHTRIFYFRSGQKNILDGNFFIGSSDWMSRNLNSRVEVVIPVDDRTAKIKILDVLEVYIQDPVGAWDMDSNGKYTCRGDKTELKESAQELLMKQATLKHQNYLQNKIKITPELTYGPGGNA